jgi:hypothetical protein
MGALNRLALPGDTCFDGGMGDPPVRGLQPMPTPPQAAMLPFTVMVLVFLAAFAVIVALVVYLVAGMFREPPGGRPSP